MISLREAMDRDLVQEIRTIVLHLLRSDEGDDLDLELRRILARCNTILQ